ncbi:hypothetical protein TPHA_0I01330 [Tetrapisispora phaffii CBS 4417]|uniref:DNA-directed RNA polymerase III subunit n=1 Tax=Tetrapisispora phaffii (strain ATCC 24235 / CBS 4417 / NBRC 1672 / NRRL Y-8282 / UCD 70-5) TaxID=1071381 RepID=G8BXL2_TETPH|nr:hypothetical protein TPHA_0I01330 [Tetrapisispora phaffii CBS 4417]CCE64640.1 hypothetical protein TPHA_0I01330 [Tetrapisispora phaffii CBS 4417]
MSNWGSRAGNGSNSKLSNLPFGLGYHDVDKEASKEVPTIQLPVNNPVNERERSLSIRYIKFQESVREGPFFTGSLNVLLADEINQNGDKENAGNKSKKRTDIIYEGSLNDGIERYSDKYLKKGKLGVSIDEFPFHLEHFPEELYKAMGINKKKILNLSKLNDKDDLFTGNGDDDSKGISILEELKDLADDLDETEEGANDGDKAIESEDEDFDDDSDNDDYNAEKYFDDGDDDFGGDEEFGDEPAF